MWYPPILIWDPKEGTDSKSKKLKKNSGPSLNENSWVSESRGTIFFKKIASKKFQALWMKKGCFWILIGRLVFLDHFMFYRFTNILKSTVLQFFTLIIFQKTFNYTHIVFFVLPHVYHIFTTFLPHFYHTYTSKNNIPYNRDSRTAPNMGIHGPIKKIGIHGPL